MFRRKIYDRILQWKEESCGRTALLVEGAKGVGKSTVVEEFAKNEYESYIFIDFAFAPSSIVDLFKDMSDLNYFFLQLQLQYRVDLSERKSLIVFDEVQLCPLARQAIKILVKDGRYDYIETGSLISIRKNVKDILIPSEEEKIEMYPMDYEEFLWATGDSVSLPLIRKAYAQKISLGEETNRKMMRNYRLYMLVGGMPQAVDTYITTNNFKAVDAVKRNILKLYTDDFNKIDPSGRVSLLFESIPAQLNSNYNRYRASEVIGPSGTDSLLELIAQLRDSKTVLVSYHVNDPNAGLSSSIRLSRFKLYVSDTGLFTTLMFKDRDFTENDIYMKLLNDKSSVNLGYLYENAVAQTLKSSGRELFYYTWLNEKANRNYEVDFLVSEKSKISPIEVKSSGYTTHTSLDEFSRKYSDRIQNRYIVYTKDFAKKEDIICLPFYMASEI